MLPQEGEPEMSSILFETIAWAGGAATLIAYGLVSVGRLDARGRVFQALNLLGAVALGASAARHGAWPSTAVNAAWFAIGIATLQRRRDPEPARETVSER
jgi:hypothetical protein